MSPDDLPKPHKLSCGTSVFGSRLDSQPESQAIFVNCGFFSRRSFRTALRAINSSIGELGWYEPPVLSGCAWRIWGSQKSICAVMKYIRENNP
jgi:hypothetical protein